MRQFISLLKIPSLLSNISVTWYLMSHFNSRFLYRMPFRLFLSLLTSDFFAPRMRGEISSCITIFCAVHSGYYRTLSLQKYYIQGFKIKFALLLNCTILYFLFNPLFAILIFLLEDTKQTFLKRNAVICSYIISQEVLAWK